MRISAKTQICMIIGDPVEHSLSPQMHNAGYEALGIDDTFVYIAAHVNIAHIQTVMEAMRAMHIRGITCTVPHKVAVLEYLDEIDPIAKKIGAANTVVNEQGKLIGYNTDWLGVLKPLTKVTDLQNKKVAILGAGGAARAMVYAAITSGASVTIYNRTLQHAETVAKEFGTQAKDFSQLASIKDADIILNATVLGRTPYEHETPLPKEYITSKHIVFDANYVPFTSRLLQEAKEQGATIIHGTEMLLYQGTAQFELYTGQKAPEDVMRKILMANIQT